LQKIGRLDLCLNSSQLDILKELCVFVKEFEMLTLVVSTNVPVLSMIPLMKLRIKRICQIGPDDDDAIKEVKKLIAQNVDRRLPENDFVSINQVLDLLPKNVVPQEVGLSLLSKAFSIAADKGIITMTTTTTNIDIAILAILLVHRPLHPGVLMTMMTITMLLRLAKCVVIVVCINSLIESTVCINLTICILHFN
jgi:hypothetical protein